MHVPALKLDEIFSDKISNDIGVWTKTIDTGDQEWHVLITRNGDSSYYVFINDINSLLKVYTPKDAVAIINKALHLQEK